MKTSGRSGEVAEGIRHTSEAMHEISASVSSVDKKKSVSSDISYPMMLK